MTAGSLHLKPGMSPTRRTSIPRKNSWSSPREPARSSRTPNIQVQSGSMMTAPRQFHGIVNTGKTPLLFYFYKWKA